MLIWTKQVIFGTKAKLYDPNLGESQSFFPLPHFGEHLILSGRVKEKPCCRLQMCTTNPNRNDSLPKCSTGQPLLAAVLVFDSR